MISGRSGSTSSKIIVSVITIFTVVMVAFLRLPTKDPKEMNDSALEMLLRGGEILKGIGSQIVHQTNPNEPILANGPLEVEVRPSHTGVDAKGAPSDSNILESIANRLSQGGINVKKVSFEYVSPTNNRLCVIHEDGNACVALPGRVRVVNANPTSPNNLTTASTFS